MPKAFGVMCWTARNIKYIRTAKNSLREKNPSNKQFCCSSLYLNRLSLLLGVCVGGTGLGCSSRRMKIMLPELAHLGVPQSLTSDNRKMSSKFFDIGERAHKITSLCIFSGGWRHQLKDKHYPIKSLQAWNSDMGSVHLSDSDVWIAKPYPQYCVTTAWASLIL